MLSRVQLEPPTINAVPIVTPPAAIPPMFFGERLIPSADLRDLLESRRLSEFTPVTALVAKIFAEPDIIDPLGSKLAQARMLRVSPLLAIPDAC